MPDTKTCLHLLIIVFAISFISICPVFGQDRSVVSGTVLSKVDNNPIDGVTISWLGKGLGSVSNTDGAFVIALNAPYTATDSLTFSCIGYVSQKVGIAAAVTAKHIIVNLKPSVENLKEVVVRPLSLKQLLDSIGHHNNNAFVSPMTLNGYYRELVFTNNKCTEFSDAICQYYLDHTKQTEGQLKITASRCRKETKENKDKDNMEVYQESKINPNQAFNYAMLSGMIDKYFPAKNLNNYQYTLEQWGSDLNRDLKVVITPKADVNDTFYQLTFVLKDDFTLKSYRLEIPDILLARVKEKSLLGLHTKLVKSTIEVKYSSIGGHIYPAYCAIIKSTKLWGKFLGTTINQLKEERSEFVAGSVALNAGQAFAKGEIYKKGNLCNNGTAINDDLLKNYTIIKPTVKDSIAISVLGN